jgi:hypothetical protein
MGVFLFFYNNMTFNTSNSFINFISCGTCDKIAVSFGEGFLYDNQKYFTINSISLSIGESLSYDLIDLVLQPMSLNTNVISVSHGSQTVSGSNTNFNSEFVAGDYIGIKTPTSNEFYKIQTVDSDTALTLENNYEGATASNLDYYKVNYEVIINATIPDGLYKVNLFFTATDALGHPQDYRMLSEKVFYCNAKCCLDKMFAMLPGKLCDTCNVDLFVKDLMMVESLVTALDHSICCPDDSKINTILGMITKICKYNNCESC